MISDALCRAESTWLEGNDAEAERLLVAERRRAEREGDVVAVRAAEATLALYAIVLDDDDRARGHLDAAEPGADAPAALRARIWLAQRRLARRRGEAPAPALAIELDGIDETDLRVDVLLEHATGARVLGDLDGADAEIARAEKLVQTHSAAYARVEQERAEILLARGDAARARVALRAAIATFVLLNQRRAEGRALLRYGEAVAPAIADEEPAAIWLGRAQAVLGQAATWRDRATLRAGFRQHGRRLPDNAIAENIASRVDALERACASLRGTVASSVDAADRAVGRAEQTAPEASTHLEAARSVVEKLPTSVAPLVSEVERVGNDLIELMGTALVERDRMRTLLQALAELDAVADVARYAAEASRIAARVLDADRVVIAAVEDGAAVERGSFVARNGVASDLWRSAVDAALRVPSPSSDMPPPSLRAEAKPRGPVLVVPIRSSSFTGAVYADKNVRSGQFRDSDHHLASLLAEYLAQGFGRIAAREAEKLALAQLAATLDAIRDGVVAVDREGVIRSINAAAARMMRIPQGAIVGRRLEELEHLGPLWAVLAGPQRADGAVVRLPHGSLVVTARPIGATEAEPGGRGIVATLIELDRAQRLALRITNARPRYGFHDVVGTSAPLAEALRLCRQAATVDANVLITGESGTGKEVLAQAIHTGGPRASEPFVGINCAALPRELLEAELFGYERGAFTGARSEGAVGKFEQAGEGTLLLDEIGDMPLDMQVKLLRVLQERVVVRLGGTRERPVLARIIATTHRNLEDAVEKGTFRLDLLFRLRVLHVHLPPLRDRPSDVEALANHFVRRVAEAQGKKVTKLGPDVVRALLAYPWPGNVRELGNVIEREVSLLSPDATVLERFEVPLAGTPLRSDSGSWAIESPTLQKLNAVKATAGAATMPAQIIPLAEVEKRAYLDAYGVCGGNVAKAAKALGVSKVTFYAKLRQWGMHPADEPPSSRREGPESGTMERSDGMPSEPPTSVRTSRR